MSDGLTYPALKCVIEHLEVNRRFHIASRSPSFRQIEKTIPLHLDYLKLRSFRHQYSIQVNRIWYCFSENSTKVGLDRIKFHPVKIGFVTRYFDNSLEEIYTGIEDDWKAVEIILSKFFGERGCINVNFLKFKTYDHRSIILPSNLSFKIRNLSSEEDFRYFLRLIDPSSFPLKKLQVRVPKLEILDHKTARSCEQLRVICNEGRTPQALLEKLGALTNQTLYVDRISLNELCELIRNWLRIQRDIGSHLIARGDWADKSLEPIFEQLNARKVIMKESNLQCFKIQTDFATEAIMHTGFDGFSEIKVTIKAAGSSAPFEPSERALPKKLEEPSNGYANPSFFSFIWFGIKKKLLK